MKFRIAKDYDFLEKIAREAFREADKLNGETKRKKVAFIDILLAPERKPLSKQIDKGTAYWSASKLRTVAIFLCPTQFNNIPIVRCILLSAMVIFNNSYFFPLNSRFRWKAKTPYQK